MQIQPILLSNKSAVSGVGTTEVDLDRKHSTALENGVDYLIFYHGCCGTTNTNTQAEISLRFGSTGSLLSGTVVAQAAGEGRGLGNHWDSNQIQGYTRITGDGSSVLGFTGRLISGSGTATFGSFELVAIKVSDFGSSNVDFDGVNDTSDLVSNASTSMQTMRSTTFSSKSYAAGDYLVLMSVECQEGGTGTTHGYLVDFLIDGSLASPVRFNEEWENAADVHNAAYCDIVTLGSGTHTFRIDVGSEAAANQEFRRSRILVIKLTDVLDANWVRRETTTAQTTTATSYGTSSMLSGTYTPNQAEYVLLLANFVAEHSTTQSSLARIRNTTDSVSFSEDGGEYTNGASTSDNAPSALLGCELISSAKNYQIDLRGDAAGTSTYGRGNVASRFLLIPLTNLITQPIVTGVTADKTLYALDEEAGVVLGGTDFGSNTGSAKVEWWSDFTGTSKQTQTISNWTGTAITFTANRGTIAEGRGYFVVTDSAGTASPPFPFVIRDTAPDFRVEIVRFSANTSTGSQTITTGLLTGITPKAVEIRMVRATADGRTDGGVAGSSGFAVSASSEAAVSWASADAVDPPDANRSVRTDCVISIINPSTMTEEARADFTQFVSGGCEINWSDAPPSAYVGIATFYYDSLMQANISQVSFATSGNSTVVSGLGYDPDFLKLQHVGAGTTNQIDSFCIPSFGYAKLMRAGGSVDQVCASWNHEDAATPGNVGLVVYNNRALAQMSTTAPLYQVTADVTVSDRDTGYRITTQSGTPGTDLCVILALLIPGVRISVGVLNAPTSTGDWAITSPGFTPQLVELMVQRAAASGTAELDADAQGFAIAMFTSDAEECVGWSALDGSTPSDSQVTLENRAVYLDDGTIRFAGDFVSMDANGWTLNFPTSVDGTQRIWPYVAFEEMESGIEGSASGSISIGGSATGTHGVTGSGSGSIPIAGSATGLLVPVGSASGSISITGSATGTHGVTGSASGTIPIAGTATGVHGVTGTAGGGGGTAQLDVDAAYGATIVNSFPGFIRDEGENLIVGTDGGNGLRGAVGFDLDDLPNATVTLVEFELGIWQQEGLTTEVHDVNGYGNNGADDPETDTDSDLWDRSASGPTYANDITDYRTSTGLKTVDITSGAAAHVQARAGQRFALAVRMTDDTTNLTTRLFRADNAGKPAPDIQVPSLHIEYETGGGAISVGGSASGTHGVTGSASGTISITGSATGTHGVTGSSSGSITIAGSATGLLVPVGVASGQISVTGSASGTHGVTGSASGSIAIAGSATGEFVDATIEGTASGLISIAGSAAGVHGVTGSASGSIAPAGSASGTHGVQGTASGSVPIAGSASGVHGVQGSASGAISIAGSATGVHGVTGAASGSVAIAGSASGTHGVTGSISGQISIAGGATGVVAAIGQASGSITIGGSATGEVVGDFFEGAASGAISIAGSATGTHGVQGAASGSIAIAGASTGVHGTTGSATGQIAVAGGAMGQLVPVGQASGTIPISGSATGEFEADFFEGTASGFVSIAGSASGVHGVAGSASGAIPVTGSATGEFANRGTASGLVLITGGAQGVHGVSGSAAGLVLIIGGATGEMEFDLLDNPSAVDRGRQRSFRTLGRDHGFYSRGRNRRFVTRAGGV